MNGGVLISRCFNNSRILRHCRLLRLKADSSSRNCREKVHKSTISMRHTARARLTVQRWSSSLVAPAGPGTLSLTQAHPGLRVNFLQCLLVVGDRSWYLNSDSDPCSKMPSWFTFYEGPQILRASLKYTVYLYFLSVTLKHVRTYHIPFQ